MTLRKYAGCYGCWAATFLESPFSYLIVFGFVTGVGVSVIISLTFGIGDIGVLDIVLSILYTGLVLAIFVGLRLIQNTREYLMYLAEVARDPATAQCLDIRKRIHHFRWFVRGVKRLGNIYTHRHFQDLVLKTLKQCCQSTPLTLTIDQITDAIELKVIEDASLKPAGRTGDAFGQGLKGELFDDKNCKISSYSAYLVDQYLMVDAKTIERIDVAYKRKGRISSESLERIKTYVPVVIGVLTLVTTAFSALEKMLAWTIGSFTADS